ncbi:sulfur carrier protein ThiS [bacterium]|nr:sulfur carrier protein ThiS [bacterium]
MNLVVNGDNRETTAQFVTELIHELDLQPKHVAVMINRKIVKRHTFDQQELHEGDQVEILSIIGGG